MASDHLFCTKATCRGTLGKHVLHYYEVLISLKSDFLQIPFSWLHGVHIVQAYKHSKHFNDFCTSSHGIFHTIFTYVVLLKTLYLYFLMLVFQFEASHQYSMILGDRTATQHKVWLTIFGNSRTWTIFGIFGYIWKT